MLLLPLLLSRSYTRSFILSVAQQKQQKQQK
jgi:hypothetical protein